nr:hypothetical protein [Tanacetum cinerariifolium]
MGGAHGRAYAIDDEICYLKELVCLKNTKKVVTELLQLYVQPVQIVPMLSKRPTFPTKDLHKTALGHGNPMYLKTAQLCRPTLYLGDVIVDPVHTPFRVYDNEETLVQVEVSRTKMLERLKDPLCKMSSKPVNYAKLNSLYDTFVPQKKLSREQLKDQLQGKDELIRKLKAQISNMKEVSVDPNLITLEFQTLETKNTQLKEEHIAVRIKHDSLTDENVSIKKRYRDLYKSKAESNSNKRNNKEVNTPLHGNKKVSSMKEPNVHVDLSTGIKSITKASKSKCRCETKTHRNFPAKSENVKRVENLLINLIKRNRVDSSLSVNHTGFISKSVLFAKYVMTV